MNESINKSINKSVSQLSKSKSETLRVQELKELKVQSLKAKNLKAQGFSLVEILIVMAIIAVLTSLIFTAWKSQYAKLQFTNSVQTVVTELYRARSEARRSSRDVTLAWDNTNNNLTILNEDSDVLRSIQLPEGVVSISSDSSQITYLAPYGRVLEDVDQFIRLEDKKGNQRDILIIGVTGKVYQKAL